MCHIRLRFTSSIRCGYCIGACLVLLSPFARCYCCHSRSCLRIKQTASHGEVMNGPQQHRLHGQNPAAAHVATFVVVILSAVGVIALLKEFGVWVIVFFLLSSLLIAAIS